ncbi:putative MFS-type transporter YcaD [compost metagenome]
MFGLTRTFSSLYLACILMQLGSNLLITYLALRLSADGVSASWGGALMAANALGMVVGSKAGQWLIVRVGHMRAYVACAGVIATAVLGHEFSTDLSFWLLLRALVGLAMMCQLMVLESWLNDCARSDQRGGVMALYMVATYIGMILGQLALSLDDGLGVRLLLGVAMAFALCQVPVALTRGMHPRPLQTTPLAIGLFLRRVPQSLLATLASGTINGSFFGLASIYASRQGLDTHEVAQFMAFSVGAGLLAQVPLGLLSDRLPRAALIRWVALLLALACLPLALLQDLSFPSLLLCGALVGCLQFCLYPLGVALANDNIAPELRVSLAGMLLLTFGFGAGVGPLLAGVLMEAFGPSSLYAFFAGCAALLGLLASQRKVTGEHLQEGAPLHHQATPNGLASATLAAAVEPGEALPQPCVAEEGASASPPPEPVA